MESALLDVLRQSSHDSEIKHRRYHSQTLPKASLKSFFNPVRLRYHLGMNTLQVASKAEENEDSKNSPVKRPVPMVPCLDDYIDDTDENVVVGLTSYTAEQSHILTPKSIRFSSDLDRSNVTKLSGAIKTPEKQASPGISRQEFSRKSPFRSVKSFTKRSSIKKFLAPSSLYRSVLMIENGPQKVLLVEDNLVHRISLANKLLKACSWEPDIANNGEEAVQRYTNYAELSYRYTAIFMDTTMPVMDGYTATKNIRNLEASKGFSPTRIIGLLGSFEKDCEKRCLDSGMNYVSKVYTVFKDIPLLEMTALIKGIHSVLSLQLDEIKSPVSANLLSECSF